MGEEGQTQETCNGLELVGFGAVWRCGVRGAGKGGGDEDVRPAPGLDNWLDGSAIPQVGRDL